MKYIIAIDIGGSTFRTGLFSETLIHHKIETKYLDDEIQNMINTINSKKIPDGNKSCKNCAYARQRSVIDEK